MDDDVSTQEQKREYVDEFRRLLDWAAGAGLTRMGMLFNMMFPSVNSDEHGRRQVLMYVSKAREEAFTPDVGAPTIGLLVTAAEHLRDFGAPIPRWEARTALDRGHLAWLRF